MLMLKRQVEQLSPEKFEINIMETTWSLTWASVLVEDFHQSNPNKSAMPSAW